MEHESDSDSNYNRCTRNGSPRLNKGTARTGDWWTGRYHPNYCIVKICQNTEKSPGDTRRLPVAQTSVKDHQPTLVWKTTTNNNYSNNNVKVMWRLEIINHIIIKCIKLIQREYKTMYGWMGKVIRWKLCKRLKFDLTDNCIYTRFCHTKKAHKILDWRPALVSINKKKRNCYLVDYAIQKDHLILDRIQV